MTKASSTSGFGQAASSMAKGPQSIARSRLRHTPGSRVPGQRGGLARSGLIQARATYGAVKETLSKTTVARLPSAWLVTARPTSIVAGMEMDWVPIVVQLCPLVDR